MTTQSDAASGLAPERGKRVIPLAWAALSALTVIAWQLTPSQSGTTRDAARGLVAAIAFLGLVKCRLVIRYFMEVRYAPRWLQMATDGWLAIMWLTLLGIYLS